MAWNKIKTNTHIQQTRTNKQKSKHKTKNTTVIIINYSIQCVLINVHTQHRNCQLQNQQNDTHKIHNTNTQKVE